MNGGQKILLRLRPAWAQETFYEEDDIVRTMLHEASSRTHFPSRLYLHSILQLTHNVHGPHDKEFYKFLDGLEHEYDDLQRSGYAGEGFYSKGHRVGENMSHDLPLHLAKAKALEAAEKRRRIGVMLGGGGRLGGSGAVIGGMTPRELAAEVGFQNPLVVLLRQSDLVMSRRQKDELGTKKHVARVSWPSERLIKPPRIA